MWEDAKRQFPVGAVVTGTVTRHAPFGVFVDLGDPDCYGLVERPEFLDAGRMTEDQYPPVGATVRVLVLAHGQEPSSVADHAAVAPRQSPVGEVVSWLVDLREGEAPAEPPSRRLGYGAQERVFDPRLGGSLALPTRGATTDGSSRTKSDRAALPPGRVRSRATGVGEVVEVDPLGVAVDPGGD
jgi:hypothetical protein